MKIGGSSAIPILSRWRWFSITLCTTLATGLLFWGMAEPLYHYNAPPNGLGDTDLLDFSLATMFMHWSFVPYGIYAVAGLAFALAYYNDKKKFSIHSMISPLIGDVQEERISSVLDTLCLLSIVAGMSASLGAGILAITGGLDRLMGIPSSDLYIVIVGVFIVGVFILSSVTGLQKGIKTLSSINMVGFGILILVLLLIGQTTDVLSAGVSGSVEYITHFIDRSTGLGSDIEQTWFNDWTVFYLANWFAWAPIAALFLGRISYGYTVRAFITMNLILPSLFAIIWLTIFSGNTLLMDISSDGTIYELMSNNGEESVMYYVFESLSGGSLLGMFALIIIFLSYVTAADSNLSAMSALSTVGISLDQPEGDLRMKVIWGVVIGMITCIMLLSTGIDGIRILSVLGGTLALFIIILAALGIVKMLILFK